MMPGSSIGINPLDIEIEDEFAGICEYENEEGVRCRNHARPGSKYCGIHAKAAEK